MKTTLSLPSIITLLILSSIALFLGAGCDAQHPYVGPTVATVGVTGSYSDRQGDTYGGGLQVGLNPPPTPTPKPVDHSK